MKKLNNYRSIFVGFGLIGAVCLILIALCLGFPSNKGSSGSQMAEETFEEQVSDKKKELEESRGLYCPDTIVLADTTKKEAESLAKKLGARVRLTKSEDFATLYLPEGTTIEDVYANEEYEADLLNMTPDYTVRTMAVDALQRELMATRPNYQVTDTLYQNQGYLDYLNMQDTWNTSKGSGIKVAIIDTGIDTDNPEFSGRISQLSYNASEDKTVKDFGMSQIEDTYGHGTQVAGVLAAGMDGNGITGIAPEAELIIIKCEVDETGNFVRGSDLVFGLAYAIERDADVVNMSFGTDLNVFEKYTKLAVDSDVICVASAGNEGSGMPVYPAADENVIGVGALEGEGWNLDSYSNFGDNSEIVAPGTVLTTTINNNYQCSVGTSLSSPIVAGSIALYLSSHNHIEFETICHLLEASSIDLGTPGEDLYYGYGALDISSFLFGQQGIITYDMQTDEIEDQTQIFIKGNSVQTMPEPERDDVVFDGWYFNQECTDECEYYTYIFTKDITLYASWINEDEGTAYIYTIMDNGEIEIQGYRGKRRYLTVPEKIENRTVTSIGNGAFEGNNRIRSITLPSTITNIGDRAFMNCTSLRAMDIPEKVIKIGEQAFCGDVRLAAVTLAPRGSLTTINRMAFSMCSISSFNLPRGLTNLGEAVFAKSTSMRSISVTDGNSSFKVLNSALYDISGESLLYYPAGLAGSYTVNAGTKYIGAYAFAYGKLQEVILPDNLQTLGGSAFISSELLKKIQIPSSVSAMGGYCFACCYALSQVDFNDNAKITSIPSFGFYYCRSLSTISIPASVETISWSAFASSDLTNISFKSGSRLKTIGISAFASSNLQSIQIPDSVVVIDDSAFAGCGILEEAGFGKNSICQSIGDSAFSSCYSLNALELPDSLANLGEMALCGSGIKSIHIGASLTSIGVGAFSYCQKLSSITVADNNLVYASYDNILYDHDKTILMCCPAARQGNVSFAQSTERIQEYAFAGTNRLTSVSMNNGLTEIGAYAFIESGIQTPSLPATMTAIRDFAFSDCKGMTQRLLIPRSINQLGRYFVYNDINLKEIEIEPESALNRIGYGTFANCGIETFTVPENVSTMGQEIFADCKSLITVTFEADSELSHLAAWTFSKTDSLRRITFEEGSNLTLIEARACEWMPSLDIIDLSSCSKLTTIDNYAFNNCESLQNILLPNGLQEIGRYAFSGCSSLNKLDLPESLNWIGRYAFKDTNKMNVYFKSSVLPVDLEQNWDYDIAGYYLGVEDQITNGDWIYALTKDNKASVISYLGSDKTIDLKKIDGHEVISIGGGAFKSNTTLETITIPETVTGIYKGAFEKTTSLKTVNLPASLIILDADAFRDSSVKTVQLTDNNSLKTIGPHAFDGTANLTTFTIPSAVRIISDYAFQKSGITQILFSSQSNLEEIGKYAFYESAVTSISLPANLTRIGDHAFHGTKQLKSISFGTDQPLTLCSNAFYDCGLGSVTIPSNVESIEELCFASCDNLEAINVDGANSKYTSRNGVLLNKAESLLITCPAGKTGDFSIPSSVTRISFGGFEGSKLSTINIPDDSNLMTIGYRAFFKCVNLKKITIPAGIQSISNYAFAYDSLLETVTIKDNSEIAGIYKSAFYNCSSLKKIIIPDKVQEIDDYAFYGCSALSDVEISESSELKGVYDYAFAYSGIKSFQLPENTFELGNYAFYKSELSTIGLNEVLTDVGEYALADCPLTGTKKLTFPSTVEYIGKAILHGNNTIEELTIPFIGAYNGDPDSTIRYLFTVYQYEDITEVLKKVTLLKGEKLNAYAFYYLPVEEVILPSELKSIGERAFFSNAHSLKSVVLPEHLEIIGFEAFSGESELNLTKLPDSIVSIGDRGFSSCGLSAKTLPASLISIGEGCFAGTKISIESLPENLTTISELAFYRCNNITHINISKKVNSIGAGAFSGMESLQSITVDPENPAYSSVDGILYDKQLTTIVAVPGNIGGDISIPSGIKTVNDYSFAECSKITGIELPNTLLEIGNYSFYQCDHITFVKMSDSLLTIGNYAFAGCRALLDFEFSSSLESIGNQAFDGCYSLKKVVIPESLKSLGSAPFGGCNSLKELIINAKIKRLEGTLSGLPELEYITFPEGLEYAWSFFNCPSLKELVFPESVKEFGGIIGYCDSLEYIYLGKSFESAEDKFNGCTNLKRIDVSENNTNYSSVDGILYDKKITKLIFVPKNVSGKILIPDGVKEIAKSTFENCHSLEEVSIPNTVDTLGEDSFVNCSSLKKIILPDSITRIERNTFYGCKNLEEIHFGSNIEYIGYGAVEETAYVKNSENYEHGILYVDNYLVDGKGYTLPVIKEGTLLIAENAFYDTNIESISIPDSVKYINYNAFHTPSLKRVRIGKGVRKISGGAFQGTSLHSIYLEQDTAIDSYAFWYITDLRYVYLNAINIDEVVNGGRTLFRDSGPVEVLRVDCSQEFPFFRLFSNPSVACKNYIIYNSYKLKQYGAYIHGAQSIYFDEEKEKLSGLDIGTATAYYKGEWNEISFIVDGILLSINPMKKGSIIQTPSDKEIAAVLEEGTSFIGWDINGDGLVDKLPATLNENINAVAVTETPVTSISIEDTLTLEKGTNRQLHLETSPYYANVNTSVSWTSSNTNIAKVDDNGKVTGVSEGSAQITATLVSDGSIKATCQVTVTPEQYGIKLDETSGTMNVGDSKTLEPRYILEEGNTSPVEWNSTNTAIAEVNNGVIQAKAPGKTNIVVTCGQYSAEYELRVLQPLTGISLDKTEMQLAVNETYTLKVSYQPANTTADKTVSWYSTKPGVAMVDDRGVVTAKGPGTAQIRATVGTKEASCTVTVTSPIESVILNTTTGTMRLDRTKQLEMIFTPANTSDDTSVTWATADPAIATVSDTGLVTALTKGKTTITGTVLAGTDREMSATYSVTVIGLKDDKTGIIVTNSDDTDTEEGVGLTVDYINDSDSFAQTAGRVQQALDQYTLEDMQIYDITLTRNGTAVQPTTTMDVEIPVSEDMVSDDTVAYRLEEDGTLTNMGASYEDGRYGFEVDHFSIYVLGKKKEEDYLPGDLDGNKKVNPLDVVLLRKYIAEGYDVTINEAAADVNADNKVNTMDVIMLRRYIVGGYDVELIRRPKN